MLKASPIAQLACAVMLSVLLPTAACADKRIALVIGNSTYQHITRLDNPRNDAMLMADTLRALNFTLVGGGPQTDLDKSGFDTVVQNFGRQLQGADVALFYYAGHGVQVRGANYLVPIGANPTREADVDFQMVDVNLVLRQMEGSGTKLNIVVLDACRNNPFGGRGLRATSGGLAQMQAPEGTLISHATQPGNVALDGVGANSPYTNALAETIRRPGLDILQAFNQVGLAVKRATGNAQQPWQSSSPIDGSFYFAGPSAPAIGSVAPINSCAVATAHWKSAKSIGSIEAFEDHLARFPTCTFGGLARAKIARLREGDQIKDRDEQKKVAVLPPSTVSPMAGKSDPQNTLLIDTKHGQVVIKLRNDIAPGARRAHQAAGARGLLRQCAVPSRDRGLHGADRRRRARRRHRQARNIPT